MDEMPHIGDTVRLGEGVGRSKRTAVVIGYDHRIKGAVHLDERLDGFSWWNAAELELVPTANRRGKP